MPALSPATATKTTLQLLESLVRFPTVSGDDATNLAALDWIHQQLAELPLTIHRYTHQSRPSLIATTRPTKTPKLWLVGHLDVVPASPELFEPRRDGNRLIGRGTYDMKSGLAVFIALLQQLADDLPHYDLGLMITTDEEIGGHDGVKWLLEQGYSGNVALIPDGGLNWAIETGAKGMMHWRVTAQGRAAHGSRPWLGVNAIDEIIVFVNALRAHLPAEPCGDASHAHTTLNLGRLEGGQVPNQVAAEAVAEFDMRLAPGTEPDEVLAWAEAAKLGLPSLKTEVLLSSPAYASPQTGPIKLFRQIAENALGRPLTGSLAYGASDARFFAAHSIPTIVVQPTGGDHHGPGEWVDLPDLECYAQVVEQFVTEYARSNA